MFTELGQREKTVDLQNKPAGEFGRELANQNSGSSGRIFYYQTKLESALGGIPCAGVADLLMVDRVPETGKLRVTVIDIKASRRATTGFRLQVAFYARLLEDTFQSLGLEIESIDGAIHLGDRELIPEDLEKFDLGIYTDEIERIVIDTASDTARAAATPLEDAFYYLGYHCDGCPYNAICFVNTFESENLSLVPGMAPAEKRALETAGIRTARQLAALFDYNQNAMSPAGQNTNVLENLQNTPALAGRLPLLNQRARGAVHRFDRTVEAKPFLIGSDFGTLPDTNQYPDLVRVFLDAQTDYLNDRVYLLSAVVAGPAKSVEVCEMTADAPEKDESELELLVSWMQRLLPAIREAADSPTAPVHFYLCERRGQQTLLGALTRHFAALCAIPAFYDLLTSSPALTQSMISFLSDDIKARRNLAGISQNLYAVAQEMGFRWEDAGGENLAKRFRPQIFDQWRKFSRENGTGAVLPFPQNENFSGEQSPGVFVEAAARFGTQIPLEYAYAAWGRLREEAAMTPQGRAQISGFLGVSLNELKSLAILRCRALRFLEESFGYKNREVEKTPLDLSRLDEVQTEPDAVPFNRALEDFLYLEHHARKQETLLHLAMSPEDRAATGRTAILRCNSFEKIEGKGDYANFTLTDSRGYPIPVESQGNLRLRIGSWTVLNELTDDQGKTLSAKRLLHGRLAVVEEIDAQTARLRLMPMNFKNSAFRYAHRIFQPAPGTVYTLDEMADDLNADKFLEACRQAPRNNHLYGWITDPEAGKAQRLIRPKKLRDALAITEMADEAQFPHSLTEAQRSIIGGLLTDRVLVLQGPPGTGKSHTLGFAALCRLLALASPSRPFRIAVTAKTHAAVSIALASIAKRVRQLFSNSPAEATWAPFENLPVLKICTDAGEIVPEGVGRLFADGGTELSAAEQWERLMREPILVVGGTPGGLYNLVKRGAAKAKSIDWSADYFDLVIIDEASQMGITEALTSAAFLREDGQFIAIGDHRQMPPILAHAWEEEKRRDLERARPHLSIFDYLREAGFRSAALDESFRIPSEIAEFLNKYVYSKDAVNFHSKVTARLPEIAGLTGWLKEAMNPAHPLVLIEHDEHGSQQANEFEALLVEQIARIAERELKLEPTKGIGIVVPHRAQKALLQARLPQMADAIDTVERFQGGERDLIIVSATVSDREYAEAESSFLLDPRRLTVAISRPKRKLIVIASRAVFDLIPAELEEYERSALWKHLRRDCRAGSLWSGSVGRYNLTVKSVIC